MMNDLFPNEASVTEQQKQALREALLHAYSDFDWLYMRLEDKWGVRPSRYFDLDGGDIKVVKRIIDFADGEGRILDLLAVTWTDKPFNPRLKALADELLVDKDGVIAKYAPAPTVPAAVPVARPSLEKLVEKRSKLLNLVKFGQGIELLSGSLCRISAPTLKGTGFLVGRRTVLTNFHVMQEAIENSLDGSKLLFEFGYRGDGPIAFSLKAAPGLTWKGPNRPYSPSDLTGIGVPAPGELDFALVTLASDVPANRLPLAWPIAPPIVSQRDFIVIGQHPQGDVAQIAFGEVLAYPGSGLRYRYDVTTEPGSSGSPVLTLDQNLVALHHAADPKYNAKYNQGVPIWLIMEALKSDGVDITAL